MPSAIEVRKVPIHSVADASELTKLIDEGTIAAISGLLGSGRRRSPAESRGPAVVAPVGERAHSAVKGTVCHPVAPSGATSRSAPVCQAP